jgi:hypothetical protein
MLADALAAQARYLPRVAAGSGGLRRRGISVERFAWPRPAGRRGTCVSPNKWRNPGAKHWL